MFYLPSILSSLQFLLNVIQRDVPLGGWGEVVGYIWHWSHRLENHLKSLARGPLVYSFNLHVCKWDNYDEKRQNQSPITQYISPITTTNVSIYRLDKTSMGTNLFDPKEKINVWADPYLQTHAPACCVSLGRNRSRWGRGRTTPSSSLYMLWEHKHTVASWWVSLLIVSHENSNKGRWMLIWASLNTTQHCINNTNK